MAKRELTYYPVEFKESSVKLAIESDKPTCQTAKNLSINPTTLYNWIAKYYPDRSVAPQNKDALQAESIQLRRENARLKQEREILKKAAAYFAKKV